MWIDKGTKYKKNLKRKIEAARRVTGVIKGMCGGRRGLGVGNARKMYVACARGTMEYGSRVWWRGEKQKGMAEQMDKENERAMRKLGGHLRTAPGGAIMVENDMCATEARLNGRQKRNVILSARRKPGNRMRTLVEDSIRRGDEPEELEEEKKKRTRVQIGVVKLVPIHQRLGTLANP